MDKICLDCKAALVCITKNINDFFECYECKCIEAEINLDTRFVFYQTVNKNCPRINEGSGAYVAGTRCDRCADAKNR